MSSLAVTLYERTGGGKCARPGPAILGAGRFRRSTDPAARGDDVMTSAIVVEPIAGALGAEISGVDLSRDLSEETVAAIQRFLA